MVPLGSVIVPAKMLHEAVAVVIPSRLRRSRKAKTWPVNLVLDVENRLFHIVESRHELAGYELPLNGTWPDRVQVDGRVFRHVVETYPANEILELIAYSDRLVIKSDRSPFSMPRLDAPGRKAIKTTPIPRNERHTGPVLVTEQTHRGRVEFDATWDFSARMPVPHHKFPNGQMPESAKRRQVNRGTTTKADDAGSPDT